MAYYEHQFCCIGCGNPGIPIQRDRGHNRSRFHRKKLWCYHCKQEVNHVEVKNEEEMTAFKEAFERGELVLEYEESLAHVRNSCVG